MSAKQGTHDREASADDADAGFDGRPDEDVDMIPWKGTGAISVSQKPVVEFGKERATLDSREGRGHSKVDASVHGKYEMRKEKTHKSDPPLDPQSPSNRTA